MGVNLPIKYTVTSDQLPPYRTPNGHDAIAVARARVQAGNTNVTIKVEPK